jgi:molybdopterin-guanine dinucleotide biosynthesis protein B
MKIFGLAGWSGSGKTTLMVRLLPELTGRGLTVSTIKHTHHSFDIDKPGKDSYEHRRAGAREVMVASSRRWALMHELGDDPEPHPDELIARMEPVDLVIIEGFKSYPHPKIEIHRPSLGKEFLFSADPSVRAIASDAPLKNVPLPVIDIDDVAAIADFILDYCGIGQTATSGAG